LILLCELPQELSFILLKRPADRPWSHPISILFGTFLPNGLTVTTAPHQAPHTCQQSTGINLFHTRFLMDSQFATRPPFEVLHRIRDINVAPIDPRLSEALFGKSAGWSDKKAAFFIFSISRLLADHHDGALRFRCIQPGL
jgi:hypothetical protein